jgi:hypothetical protein
MALTDPVEDLDNFLSPPVTEDALRGVPVPPPDTHMANRYLRRLQRLNENADQVSNTAEAERDAIDEWEKARLAPIVREAEWLNQALRAFMVVHEAATGEVTVKLPHGELSSRPVQPALYVSDTEAAGNWAWINIPDAVEFTPKLKKQPIKDATVPGQVIASHDEDGELVVTAQAVTENGEVVDGVEYVAPANKRVYIRVGGQ